MPSTKNKSKSKAKFRGPKPSGGYSPEMAGAIGKRKAKKQAKLDPYIAAQLDPFHPGVAGAKVPDDCMVPSVTNRFRGVYQVSTDANGAFAQSFGRGPYNFSRVMTGAGITAGEIAWQGGGFTIANMPCAATMAAQYNMVRTVAFGLRVKYTGDRVNSRGRMHIAIVPTNCRLSLDGANYFPKNVGEFENSAFYSQYSLNEICEQEVVIPSRILDAGSHRYRPVEGVPSSGIPSNSIEFSDGWASVVIYCDGCTPGTTVAEIEYIYHFEAIPTFTNSASNLMPVSPARNFDISTLQRGSQVSAHAPVAHYADTSGYGHVARALTMVSQGIATASRVASVLAPLL